MNREKRKMIISTTAVILLIMIVIGATFAYFKAQTGTGANVPTQVTTNTTDSLIFEVGKDIAITADMSNFTEGMGNQKSDTFIKAVLKANNKTNYAQKNYHVYLEVEKNTFTYTNKNPETNENIPELLLNIVDPEGNEVVDGISGLTYKTVTDG